MHNSPHINPNAFDDQYQENNDFRLCEGKTVPLAINEDEHMTRVYFVKPLRSDNELSEMT